MRVGLLQAGAAAALVALLACAGLAAAARSLEQSDGTVGEVAGTAIVVAVDLKDGRETQFLTVQRANGRRVVVLTEPEQLRKVRSGQRVRVGGRWLTHPGRGRTQPAADEYAPEEAVAQGGPGCGRSKQCIRAATIFRIQDQPTGDATASPSAPQGPGGDGSNITPQPSPISTDTGSDIPPDPPAGNNAATDNTSMPGSGGADGGLDPTPAAGQPAADVYDPATGATRKLAQLPVIVSANPVLRSTMKTLFIPIAAVVNPSVANSAKCAGAVTAPQLTRSEIQVKVHPELAGGQISVGGTFNRCSYGKTKIPLAMSNVTDIVPLGCASTDNTWTFTSCDFTDFDGWAEAANARLRAQGVPVDSYAYKVYLIPGGLCPWLGLAYVGCDGSFECRAWIEGSGWGTPMVYVHELGHNLYQDHSSSSTDEYGDTTCVMGHCCHDRCFNTPRAWHLGWTSLRIVNSVHLPANNSALAFSMNTQSMTGTVAGGRIDVAGWAPGAPSVFVGFRTSNNMDGSLNALGLTNKVHVYQSNIADYAPTGTTWLASLAVGQVYNVPGAFLRISRGANTGNTTNPIAVVTVTRTK